MSTAIFHSMAHPGDVNLTPGNRHGDIQKHMIQPGSLRQNLSISAAGPTHCAFDADVLSAQRRVNAALPHARAVLHVDKGFGREIQDTADAAQPACGIAQVRRLSAARSVAMPSSGMGARGTGHRHGEELGVLPHIKQASGPRELLNVGLRHPLVLHELHRFCALPPQVAFGHVHHPLGSELLRQSGAPVWPLEMAAESRWMLVLYYSELSLRLPLHVLLRGSACLSGPRPVRCT